MRSRPLVIYHANCADGFCGAWVAHRFFEGQLDLHAGHHCNPPPDVTDREVFLVDFAYGRAAMERMRAQARRIVVLDHHVTAAGELQGCPGIESVFDMGRSGARIAWDYWFPTAPPPQLLLHIEDQDLVRFALPLTREVQAALFSYPYDLEIWDRLMSTDVGRLAAEGVPIERKHLRDIRHLLPTVTRRLRIAGYEIPAANLPYTMAPDAALTLADGEAFAACYWDTPTQRAFSLRSVAAKGGVDVSEIARQFGGGGHRHAAGFRVGYQVAQSFELGL